MGLSERVRELTRLAFFSGRNRLTLMGAALTTAAGVSLIGTWGLELVTQRSLGPYSGIICFILLPGAFLVGLALIPLGILLERRHQRKRGELPHGYPKVDLGAAEVRKGIVFVAGATVLNLAIFGVAVSKGVEYSDSNAFCGQVCHTVMEPEYAAFQNSVHSRVGCAQCHIGQGAGWFVKAKLSGTRQLFAVLFHSYSRPIPSPVEALRPARETCEQCHWPQKFVGDKLLVRTHYGEDEGSTPSTTVLLLKIGGRTWQGHAGIHGRHLDQGARIQYVPADRERRVISKVVYKDDRGQLVTYQGTETPASARTEVREMDCVDCHNRPTHAFELPEGAVDRAINEGRISRELPFARKTAVGLLRADYPDRRSAANAIPSGLQAFYLKNYPQVAAQKAELLAQAAQTLREIYLRNIFPDMKMGWGMHPSHIGHTTSPGCFRCHDGNHATPDGKTITADCDACHTLLAQDETDPKVLKELGIKR
ncbi:MAG: cytochrome c family protein [Holophagaceae bacterium]|nr:cytochrome c family protein [Holophagaceae bacterium]